MAAADALMGVIAQTIGNAVDRPNGWTIAKGAKELGDVVAAALRSERQRGREEMRDRVLFDLSAHIVKAEERRGSKRYGTPDYVFEERAIALDAARSRVRSLSTED